METWYTTEQVAELLSMTPRSARKVMADIGVTKVKNRPYVSKTGLERYLAKNTKPSMYNDGVSEIPYQWTYGYRQQKKKGARA